MHNIQKPYLSDAIDNFKKVTNTPEIYLSEQTANCSAIKRFLKNTYDFTKNEEDKLVKSDALPELITDDFDLEQIWQQLELQNDGFLIRSLTNVSKLLVSKDKLIFNEVKNEEKVEDVSEVEDNEMESEDDSSDSESEAPQINEDNSDELDLNSDDLSNEEDENINVGTKRKIKTSVVDDQFFKLDEMEAFLLSEEKKLNDREPDSGNDSESADDEEGEEEDSGDIDLFKDEDSDDLINTDKEGGTSKNPRYKDFFAESEEKPPKRNKFLEDNESSEEENEENNFFAESEENPPKRNKLLEDNESSEEEKEEMNIKSSLELREERLKKKIGHLENAAISEKPWQLKGEITADSRPQNSLLEEIVDFDLTTRPAPVITEQTTIFLEDVIRQRIKDKAFDSVERKQKAVETPLEYKKKLVLDQEKSKESLAQIYEKEYLEQKEALDPNAQEREEEEPEAHKEIRKMMNSLFRKLDALSNFHYTPKPHVPELKIVSNLPAINMEEVAPVAASDANLLAPEEVKRKVRGDIIGKSERSDTDKKRERRKKKKLQRVHANEKQKLDNKINKMNPGLGNKYSKEKAKKLLERVTKDRNIDKMDESVGSKSVKSSTAFFSQLQNEVKSQIKNKTKLKQSAKGSSSISAKKMKL